MLNKVILSLAIASTAPLLPTIAAASIIATPNRDSVAYYMNLGKEDEGKRKFSTAWHFYEKASKHDSGNVEIQMAIAEVCLKMKRMAPAIRALDSATKLSPNDFATQWRLVQLYHYYDQSNKVIELLPTLHRKMPETPGWAYMLGKSYQTIQDYGKAIPYMDTAIQEDPLNAEAVYQTGRMYMLMEQYKKSLPYYVSYLEMDSLSYPTRTYELALLQSTLEMFDSSLANFDRAVARGYKPRDDFYMNMAYTMADAKKADQALTMLQEMLVRRPQDIGLLNGMAEISMQAGYYSEAVGYWDKVMAIDENPRTLYSIGTAYIKMGKTKEGQAICDRAIAIEPALGVLKHARQMHM
jgi:tetratricopeptide (TPR) repeat protein